MGAALLLAASIAVHPSPPILSSDRNWTTTIPATMPPSDAPVVKAEASILVDAVTGEEMFSQQPDTELPMASTTKIMTAALAITHGNLDRTVTVSKHAAAAEPANIAMKEGEKFTLRDLLYAMMIHSANDCAIAVAEAVGGTEAKFIREMNEEAARLGCTHTHFVTPNGLHDPEHFTTARDLSKIAIYATSIPFFNELIRTRSHRIKRSINQANVMMYRAHGDRFLFEYAGADGVKTGYTHQAGRCYVGSATRADDLGDRRLITVVLHAPDTLADTRAMMDYGFHAWTRHELVPEGAVQGQLTGADGSSSTPFAATTRMVVSLLGGQEHSISYQYHAQAQAPAPAGARVGYLSVSIDGGPPSLVPLATQTPITTPARYIRDQGARLVFACLSVLMLSYTYGSFTKADSHRRALLAARRGGVDPAGTRLDQRSDSHYR